MSKFMANYYLDQSAITRSPPHEDSLPPTNLVCSSCREGPYSYEGFRQAISKEDGDSKTGYCYRTTWAQICESISDESCNWCRVIKRTIDGLPEDKFPRSGEETVEVRFQVLLHTVEQSHHDEPGPWIDGSRVRIYVNGSKEAVFYHAYAYKGDSSTKEIGLETFRRKPYIDYAKALECIQNCIECSERSDSTCPPLEETYLPTRVIDCSDPFNPRLVVTHRQVKGRYCTLSYVWGGEQHQKTTKANIDTYIHDGINVALPQTIVDAILVTHRLGICYLWVDAMCIIQDSTEDMNEEITRMGQIYRNAYLTIIVASAFRADQGFLSDDSERAPDVLPFHLIDRSAPPSRMLLRYVMPLPDPELDNHDPSFPIPFNPLDRRAWCLQESALSHRKIIFQPPSVAYHCSGSCSINIDNCPSLQFEFAARVPRVVAKDIRLPYSMENNHSDLIQLWAGIVQDYSDRKVGVPSDKLVALAMIAEMLQSLLKDSDEYVAGLWKQNLIEHILWETVPPLGIDGIHLPRPFGYRAPTWSWASIDGSVTVHTDLKFPDSNHDRSFKAEVIACVVIPKVENYPFGEIITAKLTLRAKFYPLIRNGQNSTSCFWTPPAGNLLPTSSTPTQPSGLSEEDEHVWTITFDCLEGMELNHRRDFYILLCTADIRGDTIYEDKRNKVEGLLLLREEAQVEQYRRVAKLAFGHGKGLKFFNMKYSYRMPTFHLQLPKWSEIPFKTVTLV
ncbi:HET-domain-containing protein [Pholiota conissans]|uniref:HET-domain-containing protein n=1 Tax=Pholiota conissans TaxID=109636 RepID=A0A9P5Z2M5_9AGAR|nr:HET-domain-containing protein [Pholiota conissans]